MKLDGIREETIVRYARAQAKKGTQEFLGFIEAMAIMESEPMPAALVDEELELVAYWTCYYHLYWERFTTLRDSPELERCWLIMEVVRRRPRLPRLAGSKIEAHIYSCKRCAKAERQLYGLDHSPFNFGRRDEFGELDWDIEDGDDEDLDDDDWDPWYQPGEIPPDEDTRRWLDF